MGISGFLAPNNVLRLTAILAIDNDTTSCLKIIEKIDRLTISVNILADGVNKSNYSLNTCPSFDLTTWTLLYLILGSIQLMLTNNH